MTLPEEWYKSVMGFNVPHGQERMLYIFVAGDGAAVADSLEDAEIIATIAELLGNFTGRDIAPPDRVFRHRWTTDPYTECGYSYPTPRNSQQSRDQLAFITLPVLMCLDVTPSSPSELTG